MLIFPYPMTDIKRERAYVLWLLQRRDYSRPQLEKKLRARGLEDEKISDLIKTLTEEGLFKVDAYQRARVRQLLGRGLGAGLVKARLRGEKLSTTDKEISDAFDELGTTADAKLLTLVEKSLRLWGRRKHQLNDKEVEQKIVRSLMMKGHKAKEIVTALRVCRSNLGDEDAN